MTTEQQVAEQYRHGALERAILDAVTASGGNVERLTRRDLGNADQFHLGSHAATVGLANDLRLASGMHVIDIGAGIGGPARHFADAYGCRVIGIDLSDEYVQVANALTRRCGLADRVSFRKASAIAIPFENASFDCATLIHVGMNIADKEKGLRRGATRAETGRLVRCLRCHAHGRRRDCLSDAVGERAGDKLSRVARCLPGFAGYGRLCDR